METFHGSGSGVELPAVDERLAVPGEPYEVMDGKRVYVPPALEPHGSSQSKLAALVDAHRAEGYMVAVEMLTRTSLVDDIAPDVSLYPAARDPRTGGRQLEEIAFEIASTQRLGNVAVKAAKLANRGVRRVFAIELSRARVLEWSRAEGGWSILDRRGRIEDPALAVSLPLEALLDAARADEAIARALRAKRDPEFLAEREEGRAEGLASSLLVVLAARGLVPSEDERRRILAERDPARLERWLAAAVTCADVAALLAE